MLSGVAAVVAAPAVRPVCAHLKYITVVCPGGRQSGHRLLSESTSTHKLMPKTHVIIIKSFIRSLTQFSILLRFFWAPLIECICILLSPLCIVVFIVTGGGLSVCPVQDSSCVTMQKGFTGNYTCTYWGWSKRQVGQSFWYCEYLSELKMTWFPKVMKLNMTNFFDILSKTAFVLYLSETLVKVIWELRSLGVSKLLHSTVCSLPPMVDAGVISLAISTSNPKLNRTEILKVVTWNM